MLALLISAASRLRLCRPARYRTAGMDAVGGKIGSRRSATVSTSEGSLERQEGRHAHVHISPAQAMWRSEEKTNI